MSEDRGVAVHGTHKPASSVLIRVRGAMPSLRPAEQRVGEAVLADPAAISESSITAVARQCMTSETTVLRFCRAIGLGGYPELRIALARAAQREETDQNARPPVNGTIGENDSVADVVAKISYADSRAVEETGAALDVAALTAAIEAVRAAGRIDVYGIGENDSVADVVAKISYADSRAVEETGAALDVAALTAAIEAVSAAGRIDVYGIGASALVAHDLHQKLHRLGLISFSWGDPHLALTSAAVLEVGDVAIGISHTGTTIDTVDALRVARQHGATTIAVTNFAKSPITEEADLVLTTAARETTFRSGAMASRIAQLALIDCLFTGVAQRSYDHAIDTLETTYAAVQSRHGSRRG